jgi:phosphatidylglycerol:prolipoprotein diacylglycerol transferase
MMNEINKPQLLSSLCVGHQPLLIPSLAKGVSLMHPILFQVFGIKIYSYGLMVGMAFLLGFLLITARAKRAGENPDTYLEAAIWFIIAGIGGARLFYFIWFPQAFFHDPLGSLLSSGGLVWYGGVIGVLLATLVFTQIRKLRLLHFTDIVAPAAAIGLAIGRIGCLLAGCCYGSVCDLPWAIHYPLSHETHGLPVHPAPLYETFFMLLVAGLLLKMEQKSPLKEGTLSAWFFILASFVRFFVEGVRGDRLTWLNFGAFDVSASQVMSLFGVVLGLAIFYWQSRQSSVRSSL